VAVALLSETFGRDRDWVETGLALFQQPLRGGTAVSPQRVIGILQGWNQTIKDRALLASRARRAEGGYVMALTKIEQSWEPRLVPLSPGSARP
jgi:hypothetical protein